MSLPQRRHLRLRRKLSRVSITALAFILCFSIPAKTSAQAQQQDDEPSIRLQLGKAVAREIRAGQVHSYVVNSTAGQYVQFVVEHYDVEVGVVLLSTEGRKLIEINSMGRTLGRESLSMIASATGPYRLEIRASSEDAQHGTYEVRIERMRAATDHDRSLIAAQSLFREAEQLPTEAGPTGQQGAIKKFEDAAALYRTIHEREGEVRAIDRLGHFCRDLGETQEALDYLGLAQRLYSTLHDRTGEAHVFITLGGLYYSLGETQKALAYHNRALVLWRAVGDRIMEAGTLRDMGTIYHVLSQPRRALEYYKQALRLHRAVGDRIGEAYTLHTIAWTSLSLGDRQKALDYNSLALSLMRAVGNRGGEAYIFKNEAYVLTNLGWIHELSGEKQWAFDYYNQALPLMRIAGERNGEANTLYRLANLARDGGHLSAAREHIEAALAITESSRTKLVNQELRASYRASVQQYYDFYIDVLMLQHQHSPLEGFDAAALHVSEQARARGLLDLLTEARVDIRQGVDAALLDRERELQRSITTRTDARIHLLNAKHTDQQANEMTKELDELVSAYEDVEAKIRVASPHYAALTQAQTLSLPEIQRLLDADTVLLEYALGDEHSYLWAVTPNSVASFQLEKRSVIEAAAERVYELLTARTRRIPNERVRQKAARIGKADVEYNAAALELSRMLLGPIAALLGKKRLVIVSEGALQYIPFAALPEPVGRKQEAGAGTKQLDSRLPTPDNELPLMLEHEIVTLPSASTLALLRRSLETHKPPTKTVAVFADPVFEPTDVRVNHKSRSTSLAPKRLGPGRVSTRVPTMDQKGSDEKAGDDNGRLRAIRDYLTRLRMNAEEQPLARLAYSRKEALAIAALVPEAQRRIVLDFDVNYEAVTSAELSEYRFIHFATHALLDTDEPELSGMLLSLVDKEGRPQQNGILRLGDVYNLLLPVELVSLSACDTALGKSISGEGLVGLTRGFMYAGAPRVMASLWKVDDAATADLMKIFYEGMLGPQKLRPAAALREAQKQMWQKNKASSPFYWAGFVLQGEWR